MLANNQSPYAGYKILIFPIRKFQLTWLKLRILSFNRQFCVVCHSLHNGDPSVFDLLSSNVEHLFLINTSEDLIFPLWSSWFSHRSLRLRGVERNTSTSPEISLRPNAWSWLCWRPCPFLDYNLTSSQTYILSSFGLSDRYSFLLY